MVVCKKCGNENPEQSNFCIKCGTNLEGRVKCGRCSEWVEEEFSFCPNCGNRLSNYKLDGEIPYPNVVEDIQIYQTEYVTHVSRRPILLTGLILDVVSYSLLFLDMLTSIFILGALGFEEFMIVPYILMIFIIMGLVFSSIGLASCSKPYKLYKRRSGFIIASFVILCIMFFLSIIGAFIVGEGITVFICIEFIMMILGITFTIIGIVKAILNNDLEFTDRNESKFQDVYK